MAKRRMLDSNRKAVTPGCSIHFSYGIPGVGVTAPVVDEDGVLIALTPGHKPPRIKVAELKRHVGEFYILDAEGRYSHG
jgi:hypothetical protein